MKVETWAEDSGRILGDARAKADNWLNQRRDIAKQLSEIRETASRLLTQLGNTSGRALKRGRAAYKAAADGAGKTRRRRMSKAARARISAAQKARWAKQKAAMKP